MIFLHIPGETRKAMDLMNRRILRLAIPNIDIQHHHPLLGMVDTAIAGRLGDGAAAIGAIGIGTTIFNMIYWTCGFLRMGTSGITAQAYGARNLRECTDILVRSMSVAIVLALLLVLLRNPVERFVAWADARQRRARALAAEYFFARIWAAPASISLFAIHGWFIGMQNSKTPMVVSIISNVVNVVFSACSSSGSKWASRAWPGERWWHSTRASRCRGYSGASTTAGWQNMPTCGAASGSNP